tara:strand:- start:1360 stop:1521 length:162 start_codon:yes stop_codon:yes gene_type:complete
MDKIKKKSDNLKKAYPLFYKTIFVEPCINKDDNCQLKLFVKWCGYNYIDILFK